MRNEEKKKGSHNPEKYIELNPTDGTEQRSMKEAESKTVVLTTKKFSSFKKFLEALK